LCVPVVCCSLHVWFFLIEQFCLLVSLFWKVWPFIHSPRRQFIYWHLMFWDLWLHDLWIIHLLTKIEKIQTIILLKWAGCWYISIA
jgi:hypothetical protein